MPSSAMSEAFLEGLNPEQLRAVTHGDGPLMILAGAGSGKTRVLTHRIAWLVQHAGVDPRSILALTFTNKAAREMSHRVETLLGTTATGSWIGTFHSICLRILRRHTDLLGVGRDFAVYDVDDQRRLAKRVVKELNLDAKKFKPAALLAGVSRAKDTGQGPDDMEVPPYPATLVKFYTAYQKMMKEASALDFGDLLLETLKLFSRHPCVADHYANRFKYVLIDEYQDTNRVQMLLAERIADRWGNLCVVGDDDQSIYGWRGADLDNILSFSQRHKETTTIKLEQNYRSTSPILDAASTIISNNKGRHAKKLWTDREGGEPIRLHEAATEEEEALWIVAMIDQLAQQGYQPGEIAVLYRTHALSRPVEEALIFSGIPYVVYGGLRFYERREIKDALAYLRLAVHPDDPVALTRVINLPTRGIGARTVDLIFKHADSHETGLWDGARLAIEEGALTARAAKAVGGFMEMVEGWRATVESTPLDQLIERILVESKYRDHIEKDGDERSSDRLENLAELLSAAEAFEKEGGGGATRFLDRVALVSDMDRAGDTFSAVTLMTIHSAKGLEYPCVFISGMEEGIFPHQMSMDEEGGVEEERRLCYVAATRAKEHLHLSYSRIRRVYGNQSEYRIPSRFLSELPGMAPSVAKINPYARPPGAEPQVQQVTGEEEGGNYYLPDPEEASYSTGMKVRHPRYGIGVVTQAQGLGPSAKVTVEFGSTAKKFIAGMAKLEILVT